MKSVGPAFSLLFAAVLLTHPALGQTKLDEASSWFNRGEEAFKRGQSVEAAEAFERAYALVPHGATLYNAGMAWQAAGERARAAQAFADAVERGDLPEAQAVDAQKRLDALTPRLGLVRVTAPTGTRVTVAHVEDRRVPFDLFLSPGTHEASVKFEDGERVSRSLAVVVGPQSWRLSPAISKSTGSDEQEGRSESSRRTIGWVAIGGAGVLAGGAVYLGLEALEARDTFDASRHTDADAHDRAASLRTWTNVAWAAAGAAAVTGVVLVVGSDGEDDEDVAWQSRLLVNPGNVAFATRW